MSTTAPVLRTSRRPSLATRRVGYVTGAGFNVALLYLIHGWPGWEAVPFLTDRTPQVLGLVTLSLIVGVAVNVAYLGYDPPWITALGAVITTGVGLAALIRIWQVFPFSFTGSFDWALLARGVLVVAIAGSVIGLVVQVVQAVARFAEDTPGAGSRPVRH